MEMDWEKSMHFWVLWWSQAARGARLLIIDQKSKVKESRSENRPAKAAVGVQRERQKEKTGVI